MSYLGISAGFHDASISVIDYDGSIKFAGHAERYSKQKNDRSLNTDIFYDAYNYTNKITHIAYYEKPLLKQLRNWRSGMKFDWRRVTTMQAIDREIPPRSRRLIGTGIPFSSYHHHKYTRPQAFKLVLMMMLLL